MCRLWSFSKVLRCSILSHRFPTILISGWGHRGGFFVVLMMIHAQELFETNFKSLHSGECRGARGLVHWEKMPQKAV